MNTQFRYRAFLAAFVLTLGIWPGLSGIKADERFIVVQSTTSTRNSGLYDHILPIFTRETGVAVRVVAVGTGQAIRNATRGDGDVLLVHARDAEEQFVASGLGVERFDLMYNDFVIVGPPNDPAAIASSKSASDSLTRISDTGAEFVSRGDDSGTHRKELELWNTAQVNPDPSSGSWYMESGSGMGATLNIAAEKNAYTLTDRATWIAFRNKRALVLLVSGDSSLVNQYGIILVNPAVFPHVNAHDGQLFIDWMLSDAGQSAIASFVIDGQQLFFPNAR